jgi:hypothetical protein
MWEVRRDDEVRCQIMTFEVKFSILIESRQPFHVPALLLPDSWVEGRLSFWHAGIQTGRYTNLTDA